MTRARKQAGSKHKTQLKNAYVKQLAEERTKVTQTYRNFVQAGESRRRILENCIRKHNEDMLRRVDHFIVTCPSDICNMTVRDFLKGGVSVAEDNNHSTDKSKTVKKGSELPQVPMESDDILVCTVDEALMNLQSVSAEVPIVETKRAGRKAKKAPPTVTRKKHANAAMETPANRGPVPVTWKDTPFISMTQKNKQASRYLTPAEAETADFKLVCVAENGDQIMCAPRRPSLCEYLQKTVREIQEKIRKDAMDSM